MSADNWAICPKCFPASRVNRPKKPKREFREDYWLGVDDDGDFDINYTGRCITCDFKINYNFSVNALTVGESK